jgi:hypothetical protein
MKQVEVVCSQCGIVFLRLKKQFTRDIKTGTKKFYCSKTCHTLGRKNGKIFICKVCSKLFYRNPSQTKKTKTGDLFCSKQCSNIRNNGLRSGEDHPGYKTGKAIYRKRALEKYGKVCTIPECGYDVEAVLQVHHRDGNRNHNKVENLDVLCPTHHWEFEMGVRNYCSVLV